ncbi:VOC family protein [soil metagenome]
MTVQWQGIGDSSATRMEAAADKLAILVTPQRHSEAMTETRTYPHGVPCWVDVVTTDLDEARRFYSGLFDWTFQDAIPAEAPGSYLIATLGGLDVAALQPAEAGDQIAWRTYIAVDDADAAARTVEAAGGTVTLAPVDAGPGGRQAGCLDPHGAAFRLWQPRNRPGAQAVNVPGTWNFSDLLTADPQAATAFYARLFGWEVDDAGFATMVRRPGYGDHLEASVYPDIRAVQSEVSAPPGFEDAIAWMVSAETENWQVSFAVADRDSSASTAESLGGTVVVSEDTYWTKTATVRDPEGAQFVLSQFTPPGG